MTMAHILCFDHGTYGCFLEGGRILSTLMMTTLMKNPPVISTVVMENPPCAELKFSLTPLVI